MRELESPSTALSEMTGPGDGPPEIKTKTLAANWKRKGPA